MRDSQDVAGNGQTTASVVTTKALDDVLALMPSESRRYSPGRDMRDRIRALAGGRGSCASILLVNGRWTHVVAAGREWAIQLAGAFEDVRSEVHGDEYRMLGTRIVARTMKDLLAVFPVQAGDRDWMDAHLFAEDVSILTPAERSTCPMWMDLELTAAMIGVHAEKLRDLYLACVELSPDPIVSDPALAPESAPSVTAAAIADLLASRAARRSSARPRAGDPRQTMLALAVA